ncbi:MAG: hypothetical protein MK207_11480 [Saprospiraceae bacterium]|nr:hypothetical protein [Saprospiraceae bacterium]
MSFLFPLIAIVAGILAASSVVIKKLPDASDVIDKIKPYEGFIGAAALAMALFSLFSIKHILRQNVFDIGISFVSIGACIVMGFLLGYPVLQDLFIDDLGEEAKTRSEEIYERLTPYKVTSGLVAIGTGLYLLIL